MRTKLNTQNEKEVGESPRKETKTKNTERLSAVVENYLLSLYILNEDQRKTTLGQLATYIRRLPAAEGLGTSLSSVSGMLRRMSRDQLVEISPQKEIRFTKRGAYLASIIARRHRLAERLVVDLLGVSLPRAAREAHMLEHAISEDLEERIHQALGFPTTCPFGRPIPNTGYQSPKGNLISMDKAAPSTKYTVCSLPDEDPQFIEFLCKSMVLPGEPIKIIEMGHYRHVITFHNSMGESAMGFEAASRIWLSHT